MAVKKASKQVIVDAIIKEIENGATRGKVVAKFCKKFQKSDRTIDSYWKIANEQYSERQQKAKEASDKAYIESSAQAAKQAVMSSQERKEVLTKLIRGEMVISVKSKEPNQPTIELQVDFDPLVSLKAIAELNKMDGSYAPTKVAQTDTEGKDVKPFDLSKLTDDELRILAKIQSNGGVSEA